jgi:hypothetical protein
MKLLIMQFSPAFRYFISLRSEYSLNTLFSNTLSLHNYRTQHIGKWMCFRPHVRGETPTRMHPLERTNLNPVTDGPNRTGVCTFLISGQKQFHFPKRCVLWFLEYRTVDKVKTPVILRAMGCAAGEFGFDFCQRQGIHLFSTASRPAQGPAELPVRLVLGGNVDEA